jgi:hypothetical protein
MYHEQKTLPYEKNWANHMVHLLNMYNLDERVITTQSLDTWKKKAKEAVCKKAFEALSTDAATKSKTANIQYNSFTEQAYLSQYRYKEACTIFKLRSRSVDCKGNRQSSNKTNLLCRLCEVCDETQRHIINCPVSSDGPVLDMSVIYDNIPPNNTNIIQICARVDSFNRMVNEKTAKDRSDDNGVCIDKLGTDFPVY